MARSFRSRRYAPRLRRRYRVKKSSLSKIKKDIMKCNFPTKVKFMGLTEKKTMFLTKTQSLDITENGKSIYLNPLDTDNIVSIMNSKQPITTNTNVRVSNWDKICILGIYIKFQPKKNVWNAGDEKNNINTVKCTYNMNNVEPADIARVPNADPQKGPIRPGFTIEQYDQLCLNQKQVFTFNSNESFTLYIPAPTTMEFGSACVLRSKTWWSLANMVSKQEGARTMEESEDETEETDENLEGVLDENDMGNFIHAGRLYFESAGANYNITINYKVALKG